MIIGLTRFSQENTKCNICGVIRNVILAIIGTEGVAKQGISVSISLLNIIKNYGKNFFGEGYIYIYKTLLPDWHDGALH